MKPWYRPYGVLQHAPFTSCVAHPHNAPLAHAACGTRACPAIPAHAHPCLTQEPISALRRNGRFNFFNAFHDFHFAAPVEGGDVARAIFFLTGATVVFCHHFIRQRLGQVQLLDTQLKRELQACEA